MAALATKFRMVPKSLTDSIQATRVDYRQVGWSGLRVSSPILGCMAIGNPLWLNWALDEREVGTDLFFDKWNQN